MARVLYFDCFSGLSGDMILGGLLDLGLEPGPLRAALAAMDFGGWRLEIGPTRRMGIAGTRACIQVDQAGEHEHHVHHHGHRFSTIRARIEGAAGLPPPVRAMAVAIFTRLAHAEARVHGAALETVHFHEVGAVDSVLDVVGCAYGLWRLGLDRIESAPVPAGRGFVQTAHGRMPLPAPATMLLLEGAPIVPDESERELVTPTGAAILREAASAFGPIPAMVVESVGAGAGARDLPDRPNLLRLFLGRTDAAAPDCQVVEANVDDMNPEVAGWLMAQLFAAGALDAWFVPMQMKKGRPGVMVGALATAATVGAVEATLLTESTAIGLRRYPVQRTVLPRRIVSVETPFGSVPVKVAERDGVVLNAAPEHAACAALAAARGVPLKLVYQHAVAAWIARSAP